MNETYRFGFARIRCFPIKGCIILKPIRQLLTALILITAAQLSFGQVKSESTEKAVRFTAIPMISYNRTQGAVIGVMTSAFYKINKKDSLSPPSNTGFIGIYTAENSWIAGIGQQIYLKQDNWRARAFLFRGNLNFQYFNGDPSTNVGEFEDYANDVVMAVGEVQRKIWKRLYLGVNAEYNYTTTHFLAHGDSVDERSMNNLGYIVSQDSRKNVYFPTRGIYMNFKNRFYGEWIGSPNTFTRFDINYNQFFDLKNDRRHILVARLNASIAAGDVPFQGQAVVGGDDLRGYSQGQYRGNQVYAIQSEYRWMFRNSRFGAVGFFGIASAVETFSDLFDSPLLPGGGAGIRFRAIPSMAINIGIDVGFGKDDYSLTFRIGEAFAR